MKHIHFIGICGTGMGSLAGLFKEAGFHVTGSDAHFYPPMSTQLEALNIPLFAGFDPKNLNPRPDTLIIGNVCTKENLEVKEALKLQIPYFSLPAALQHFFLKEKKALIVAGTHGKTTTTSLLAWVLTKAGLDPSFLVGGIPINFGKSFHLGRGDFFVVEGDEYDSAFFDKKPKFSHYQPFGAILTSVEWDHVDIYPNFEAVIAAFEIFIKTLQEKTILLAAATSPTIAKLTKNKTISLFTYGLKVCDYQAEELHFSPEATLFHLNHGKTSIPFASPLFGEANLENTLAVCGLCHQLGVSWDKIVEGVRTFQGVKKRQEIKGNIKGVTVIDDFAHHPTAIQKTIQALKQRFQGERLIIVFEPRSNTSRRSVHYKEYLSAFKGANRVILAPLYRPEKIPPAERLNTAKLADDLMRKGIDAYAIDNHDAIIEFILRNIGPQEVVAFFSNGDFENIHEKFLSKLERRKIFENKKEVRSIKVKS